MRTDCVELVLHVVLVLVVLVIERSNILCQFPILSEETSFNYTSSVYVNPTLSKGEHTSINRLNRDRHVVQARHSKWAASTK
jgi:hypothetical protein